MSFTTTRNTNATSGHYPRMIDNGEGELLTFLGVAPMPTAARCSSSKTKCGQAAPPMTPTTSRKRA